MPRQGRERFLDLLGGAYLPQCLGTRRDLTDWLPSGVTACPASLFQSLRQRVIGPYDLP